MSPNELPKNISVLRDFLNFRISGKWFLSYSIICADGGYRYPQHIWKRDYRRTGGVRNLHSQVPESGLFRKDVPNQRNSKRMDV